MIFYLIVFITLGFFIGLFLNKNMAIAAIAIISIGWMFVYGLWAFVTCIELLVGYTIGKIVIREMKKED